MSYISIQHVSKIFGPKASKMLDKVHQGMDKTTLLNQHGHSLGLYDINLEIDAGEIFVIMGLSGSGKSTLIRHFNRLIEPTKGKIIIDGKDIIQLSQKALRGFRRDHMSMVFQHFGLMPHRKVIDNVAYGLSIQNRPRDVIRKESHKWLELVGLAGYQDAYPKSLSGGEQQRVGLARALAAGTDILLMDEAFSALDPLIRSQMQQQLLQLQSELNKTIIFITHDLSEAVRLGTRIAILNDGKLAQIGTPEEILLDPADDYVRKFVQDVELSSVITAERIMQKPQLILDTQNPDDALKLLDEKKLEYAWLRTGKNISLITREQLRRQPPTCRLVNIASPQKTLPMQATLGDLIALAIGNPDPIPLVDEHRQLVGVVNAKQIIPLLSSYSNAVTRDNETA